MPMKLIRDLVNEADSTIRTGFIILVYIMVLAALSEITGMTDVVKDMMGVLKLVLVIGVPFGVVALIAFLKRNFSGRMY
jgi:hypothetical protein